MQIFYELRYPTRWYTKLIMALLALVFFAVLATTSIAGFLVYRIVKPQRTSSEINMGIGLDEGLILRHLGSKAAGRVILQQLTSNPKAAARALQRTES